MKRLAPTETEGTKVCRISNTNTKSKDRVVSMINRVVVAVKREAKVRL